jgi:hypothetical protein
MRLSALPEAKRDAILQRVFESVAAMRQVVAA